MYEEWKATVYQKHTISYHANPRGKKSRKAAEEIA
jgi:hypothetical protein